MKDAEPPREIGPFLWFTLREIVRRRKWFLIPFWGALALLAIVLFLLGGSYLLPAIYIAF
jgi:hypothetical protein